MVVLPSFRAGVLTGPDALQEAVQCKRHRGNLPTFQSLTIPIHEAGKIFITNASLGHSSLYTQSSIFFVCGLNTDTEFPRNANTS